MENEETATELLPTLSIFNYQFSVKSWLGDRDSNPDRQIQRLQSYH